MVVVVSPEGKIQYANEALKTKLGYTGEELNALHLLDLHPAEYQAEAKEILAAILQGKRATCPIPVQSKDGAVIPVETHISFGKWKGKECIFGISRDLRA